MKSKLEVYTEVVRMADNLAKLYEFKGTVNISYITLLEVIIQHHLIESFIFC